MFNKDACKDMDLGACCDMMSNFFNSGSKEEGKDKFDFKNCEQMMKQFCAGQDGKFDLQSCRSMMSTFFGKAKQE